MDIAIKHRFFAHLAGGDDPDSERLYRWHILRRTGGREPRSWKVSVGDYVHGCRDLLGSMRHRGFDADTPIVVGSNGALMDGAHRLSCALLLGQHVAVKRVDVPGKAPAWGAAWMARNGASGADIARIKADFARL